MTRAKEAEIGRLKEKHCKICGLILDIKKFCKNGKKHYKNNCMKCENKKNAKNIKRYQEKRRFELRKNREPLETELERIEDEKKAIEWNKKHPWNFDTSVFTKMLNDLKDNTDNKFRIN